jgi:hypothetical protein
VIRIRARANSLAVQKSRDKLLGRWHRGAADGVVEVRLSALTLAADCLPHCYATPPIEPPWEWLGRGIQTLRQEGGACLLSEAGRKTRQTTKRTSRAYPRLAGHPLSIDVTARERLAQNTESSQAHARSGAPVFPTPDRTSRPRPPRGGGRRKIGIASTGYLSRDTPSASRHERGGVRPEQQRRHGPAWGGSSIHVCDPPTIYCIRAVGWIPRDGRADIPLCVSTAVLSCWAYFPCLLCILPPRLGVDYQHGHLS